MQCQESVSVIVLMIACKVLIRIVLIICQVFPTLKTKLLCRRTLEGWTAFAYSRPILICMSHSNWHLVSYVSNMWTLYLLLPTGPVGRYWTFFLNLCESTTYNDWEATEDQLSISASEDSSWLLMEMKIDYLWCIQILLSSQKANANDNLYKMWVPNLISSVALYALISCNLFGDV
jgi:hypothetical protein